MWCALVIGCCGDTPYSIARDGAKQLEPSKVISAVDVEYFAGGEGEVAAGDGGDGFADVVGLTPAFDGGKAIGD